MWGASEVRGTAYLVGRPALDRPVRLAVVGVKDVPIRPLAPAHVARDGRTRGEAWWRGGFGREARNVHCVGAPVLGELGVGRQAGIEGGHDRCLVQPR